MYSQKPTLEKNFPTSIQSWFFRLSAVLAAWLSVCSLPAQVQVAGTLYVDLRATNLSAGTATWINQGTLGNFTLVGSPSLVTNVLSTSTPGVIFDGIDDAYQGPNAVADLAGGSDRSIEVWAFNPALANEETTVSWGHRNVDGRNLGFNFGSNAVWGAVTHFGPAYDVSWGGTLPGAGAWRHLTYTYSNSVTRVYIDGALANALTLGTALSTFTNEPINLGCQRDSSNGVRSFFYSGYVNTVRVHGGVLSSSQVLSNFSFGLAKNNLPPAPGGLSATADYNQVFLQWNASAGATRYTVKRTTTSGGPYTNVAFNVPTTSYLDTPLTPGLTYYYVVSAGNVFGDGTNSSQVAATTGTPHALDGVLHRWSFSETNGTSLEDTIAGADGQVITIPGGGDYALANGQLRLFGGAKGTADYAEMPGGLLDGLTNVTIEAWVTPYSAQNWARLFDFGSGGAVTGTSFFLSLCRAVSLNVQRLECIPYTVDTGLPTIPGQQYHYVAIWGATNGAGGVGRMEWYRDGVLAGGVNTGPTTVASADDTVLWLGRSQYPDATADADFNEFRIYNRVLTPAEIAFNFANGPNNFVPAPPDAVNDSMTMNPGAMALIPVLQNDQGASIDPATVTIVSSPASGTAVVKPGGKVLYTHNGGLATSDQFNYTVKNTAGGTSDVATVSITISSALRLPNTTITVPNTPPPVAYQTVDAFPGLFFEDPLAIRTPPGKTNQLFIAERRGIISYIPDINAVTPVRQVFLDIRDQVRFDDTDQGEMGLLSMEFHPGFSSNGIFFVFYTTPPLPTNPFYDRVSRFTANPIALTVNTNTQQVLFSVEDEAFNHNGGDMHFGPDGYLYIGMGDEGDQYNFRQNAQRIDKDFYSGLLRIDVDKKPGNLEPKPHAAIPTNGLGKAFYSIPLDNPFVGATNFFGQPINTNTLRAEFWAVGFRHIWRFSIDAPSGEIWVGDVGQDRYEEVDVVEKGGNYGWAYYEGVHLAKVLYPGQNTLLTNPPPGLIFPIYEYIHAGLGGDPSFSGDSITGGFVYRGNRMPELVGAYIFADFEFQNIWALRRIGTNVTVERLGAVLGIAGFGVDPGNGDVLIANYFENRIERLVRQDATTSNFPQTLSDTGVFADLATLTPNPGIVSYEPQIAFWSDYALKRRWFTIPDLTNKVTFAQDTNWTLPTGMKWIKHFDLELTRGNPGTKRRLETRVLVKTATGNYGVSYKWNDAQTEAFLVGDTGTNFTLTVQVGTNSVQQLWEIPSRPGCIVCHSPAGGHALTFNTREMNCTGNLNGNVANQIDALDVAGYFSGPVPPANTLPVYAKAGDTNASLEFRSRSYLAVNCVQCHQPGGTAPSTWDARPYLALAQTGLINGTANNNGGNPTNKIILPGDLAHSILWQRIQGSNGFGRMPPLATHELDQTGIQLLADWITQELPSHLTYAQWIALYPALTGPSAQPGADPDGDSASNQLEYLTGSNPQNPTDAWKLGISSGAGLANVSYPGVPNLAVVIETSSDLVNWSTWNVPGNQPYFGSSSGTLVLQGPLSVAPVEFFRARVIGP